MPAGATPDPLAPYAEFLQHVHAHIVRLGVREHLLLARIIQTTQRWPLAAQRTAVASALARSAKEHEELLSTFDRCWPRTAQTSTPVGVEKKSSRINLRQVLRKRWRLISALLFCGCYCIAYEVVVRWEENTPRPSIEQQKCIAPQITKTRPDTHWIRQPIPDDSAPKFRTTQERPPLVPLPVRLWFVFGSVSLLLAALGLFLARLGAYLKAQQELWQQQQQQEEAQQRKEADKQHAQGEAERERLEVQAIERGDAVRTDYRIPLLPSLPAGVVEDVAVLLGRMFRHVKGHELDVPKTVRSTIHAGGEARAEFLPQRHARELVVLYHEGETRPYLPGFLALLRKWKQLGVRVAMYPFERHPGELREPDRQRTPVQLAALVQRHEGAALILFASQLAVKGDAAMLDWPTQLRAFALRAWLDPDPRLPSDRDRDNQASIRILTPLLSRFPLTSPGVLALARFLLADGVAIKRPSWDALSPLQKLNPADREALTTWIALAAQVPDAHWLQFEGLRQALLAEELPDPRSIRWAIDDLSNSLGVPVSGSGTSVALSPALRKELLDWLDQHRKELLSRAAALLKSWLPPLPEGEAQERTLKLCDLQGRHIAYQTLADPKRSRAALTALLGGPQHVWASEWLAVLDNSPKQPQRPPIRLGRLAKQSLTWATVPAMLAIGFWLAAQKVALLGSAVRPPAVSVTQTIPAVPYERVLKVESFAETESRPALIPILAGKFMMGSPKDEPDRRDDEEQHEVELTQPYLMMETEVTQGQYQAVMGENPSNTRQQRLRIGGENSGPCESGGVAPSHPVYCVDWYDAVEYANRLSASEGLEKCYQVTDQKAEWPKRLKCKGYRLPTEAEWEYAARAGQSFIYAGSNNADEVAWYSKNAQSQTHPVKDPSKKPNAWKLYGMSGNVWEWVWDSYGSYKPEEKSDPTGPLLGGSLRGARGGSWSYVARGLRVADRDGSDPGLRYRLQGFRLSRSYP
jgi:formylglycine-generating enzyme required for sulfatase activity